MGGEDNLYVGVELEDEVYELLLPVYVQAHLGLVHEQHVGLVVLDQHGEQDGEYLLLAAGQLVGQQCLAYLREPNLVLCAHNLLARVCEESVYHVLELLLGLTDTLGFGGTVAAALLEHADDAVAYVDLVIEVAALQLEELPVELGDQRDVNLGEHVGVEQRPVERAYDIVAYPLGVGWAHGEVDALEHVAGKLAAGGEALAHLVEDGALAHAVDTAQHIDAAVQLPHDMTLPAPQRLYLYLLDVIGIFLHDDTG